MKTYSPKPREVTQEWFVVDATNQTLGRLATVIANTITGKLKPQYAPHVDVGDYVIVLNCAKIRVTGNKLEQKKYYRHSGFPGGLKERTLQEQLDRHPEEVIRKAVKGMVPRNRMGASQLKKLKIFQGDDHPHDNFNPQPLPGVEKN
ncbi:MAG: rplM [Thermoleophilia bacterium]|nr:rplM [Thermoleophilia bacterium]